MDLFRHSFNDFFSDILIDFREVVDIDSKNFAKFISKLLIISKNSI